MIRIEFSELEKERLHHERYHHPHPRVQQKMEALWLKSQGVSHKEIARLLRICENTLRSYFRQYQQGGIEALKELPFYQPASAFAPHQKSIEEEFTKHPPHTSKEAAARLEQLTGIKRSAQAARVFLKSLGFSFRKVGLLPAKADVEEQEEFLKKKLTPCLEEAQEGKREVYFVDGVHFVMGAFLGFVWSLARVFIRAASGRKRLNVLGALNAITHEVEAVCNATSIRAVTVCELIRKLALKHKDKPVTIVIDNARYFRNNLVIAYAQIMRVELLFLPTYSPNLNLIERLWKFVKKKCLYSIFYSDFDSFCAAIKDTLSKTQTEHQEELKTLLTLHFQSLKEAQKMAI